MKTFLKSLIALLLFCSITSTAIAQNFEEDLKTAFNQFDTSRVYSSMMAASAGLDLVVSMWPEEYAANYYAAYAKAMVSYQENDGARKDLLIDVAEGYFLKVKELKPADEETFILAALIANARLTVDGGSRWKKYGDIFEENIAAARKINPNNPRIDHLKGVALFFTPKMFGGGKKNALAYLEKAKMLFEKETQTSVLVPHWGKGRNGYFLGLCTAE
jgi:hypothetical protein